MSTEYTPGPWKIDETTIGLEDEYQSWWQEIFEISSEQENSHIWIAFVQRNPYPGSKHNKQMKANAHLLAAAPDLYEALEMVRDADEDCRKDGFDTIPPSARAKIDKALAKAEGRDV